MKHYNWGMASSKKNADCVFLQQADIGDQSILPRKDGNEGER